MIKGYKKFKFQEIKYLAKVRNLITKKLKSLTKNRKINLSNYHKHVSDKDHENIQWKLAEYFRKKKLHVIAFQGIKNFLFYNFGQDILIQKKPFLRIARPFKSEDNIGLHKDTIYGQNPFEMSIHVPLMKLGKKSCLKFAPNSYLLNEKKIKFLKSSTIIKKGSKGHKLGKPYKPKRIQSKKYKEKPIPLNFGEYIFFTPATIHGQEVNKDNKVTRFSFDVRISSSFFPVKFNIKSHNGSYIEFSKSSTSTLAKKYLSRQ